MPEDLSKFALYFDSRSTAADCRQHRGDMGAQSRAVEEEDEEVDRVFDHCRSTAALAGPVALDDGDDDDFD